MASLKHGQGEGKKGFFARWFESIAESRMRQAQNEMQLHKASAAWMKEQEEKDKEHERAETKH